VLDFVVIPDIFVGSWTAGISHLRCVHHQEIQKGQRQVGILLSLEPLAKLSAGKRNKLIKAPDKPVFLSR